MIQTQRVPLFQFILPELWHFLCRSSGLLVLAWLLVPALAADAPDDSNTNAGLLGISVRRVSEDLRNHLRLEHGGGLLVDRVFGDSIAESKGFQKYDVLLKMDDQWLVHPQQFDVLLESCDGEEKIVLHLIRSGKAETIVLDRSARSRSAVGVHHNTPPSISAPKESLSVAQIPTKKSQDVPVIPSTDVVLVQPVSNTITRTDPDYKITIERIDETILRLRDSRGRIVFNAAIDTPEQRSRMPLVVRGRVMQLEKKLPSEPSNISTRDRTFGASVKAAAAGIVVTDNKDQSDAAPVPEEPIFKVEPLQVDPVIIGQ